MSAPINQKEYLKKYLSGPSKDKKKKKKKTIKGAGLRIIDHDLDLSKLRPLDGDELDILGEGEDAPQVAGIIDERPEEIRKMEQFNTSSKWRVISQDDGFNSKLQIEEIKKDRKQQEEENVITFGKMYSDSEDETKKDSDVSPPRNNTQKLSHNDRDSDVSPPRKNSNSKATKGYDSDVSPPRKAEVKPKSKERRKPSRWGNYEGNKSPQRNSRSSRSPKRDRKNYDSDASPPRKSAKEQDRSRRDRNNYDSDEAPPRKSAKAQERSRKDKNNYDSDASPPRKSSKQKDTSRKDRNNYDSDASPPRKSKKLRRKSSDSDISPPRKSTKRRESPVRSKKETRRHKSNNSDSDMSPPRKSSYSKREKSPDSDVSPPRRNRRANDSPPPSNRKMAKTLEGKLAGLQDAVQLRKENEAFRRREEEAFSKMTDEVSGRNATVNRRNNKRETSEERRKLKEKAERQKELDDKYKKWSKGVKQVEALEARQRDFLHEAGKPLARLAGDADLERGLRATQRQGDPMAKFLKKAGDTGQEKPSYKGSYPPNRFNIRPGFRWDGVDRSNGYEKKYFETQSKKRAEEDEYYKWSSADM